MKYRLLGTTDIKTSVIGLGCWAIGGWMWGGSEESEAVAAIESAPDAGINLIDTAPMYGFGRSEEIVGKAIKGRRDRYVLATKCGLRWSNALWPEGKGVLHFCSTAMATVTDASKAEYYVYKYLRPESIREEVEESLKRLGTDRIDLLQTHWQDPTTPLEDTMEMLLRLKDEGKIRAIGCSNASVEQLRHYRQLGPLDVDQERLSLLDREVLGNGILDACREGNVSFLAYSPLANGLLSGKFTPDQQFKPGDMRGVRPRFEAESIRRVNAKLDRIKPIAEAHGLTFAQLAIAWTAATYEKMHVLVGARNPKQIAENAQAGTVELTTNDVAEIEKLFDRD